MKIKISDIKKNLLGVLVKKGVSKKNAEVIVDEYVEGELMGKYSHGLTAFPSIIKKISGIKFKKEKILKKTHSFLFMDANNNLGVLVGRNVADKLIVMAKKEGVAVGSIKNMLSWLRPGTVAKYLAQQGFLSFVVNTGGRPMMAPPGGFEPQIGTNPIGIGIPTEKDIIVIDMATSKRAWGEVRIAKRTGKKLPSETYFDKTGKFTQDALKAYSVIAMGDYKGFALGTFVEVLCGSFLGMRMGKQNLRGDYRTLPRGAFILVMNPKFTTSSKKFKEANAKLIKDIKKSKKRRNSGGVTIPGEVSMKKRKENINRGYLDVDAKLWEELNKL